MEVIACWPKRNRYVKWCKTRSHATSARLIPTMAAATTVFETAELLSLICSHATIRASARILRTKKSGFVAAVPFVWRNVDGVIYLLNLLPSSILYGKPKEIERVVGHLHHISLYANSLHYRHSLPCPIPVSYGLTSTPLTSSHSTYTEKMDISSQSQAGGRLHCDANSSISSRSFYRSLFTTTLRARNIRLLT